MIPRNQTNEWQAFKYTLKVMVSVNILTLFVLGLIGYLDQIFIQTLFGWSLLSFLPSSVGMLLVYYETQKKLEAIH